MPIRSRGWSPAEADFADELWRFWWRSPMALMWSEYDAVGLCRLVDLTVAGGSSAPILSERRQLEDRYGLNPVGRRRLFWRIEGVDTPSRDAAGLSGRVERKGPPSAGGKRDPRRKRLQSIDGGKA